jgi:site-specific recombinase XerD
MAVVEVYTRHSADCKYEGERFCRRCDCRKWLQYQKNGHQIRASAKTRNWEAANKRARQLENELEAAERGEPVKAAPATVENAVKAYLADKETRGLQEVTIRKSTFLCNGLVTWCDKHDIFLLKDVSASLLTNWRNTWKYKSDSGYSLRIHWAVVKAFFKWATEMDLISSNPAQKVSRVVVRNPGQRLPYTRDAMTSILKAVQTCTEPDKMRALVLLMRWSGLAIQDALLLNRSKLDASNRILTHRMKNGAEVFVPIPSWVADTVRELPNGHPDYFFWDGKIKRVSLVNKYVHRLERAFKRAKIENPGTHRFRHTFAVECLLAGISLESVSKMLGHENIKTTQKTYSAWVPARQQQLENEVQAGWARMEAQE